MMNIFLLEDNVTDASLTKRNLEHSISGCSVEIAPTVKQAKEMLKKDATFDIALLDMQLPDGTGLDVLMEIRISRLKLPVIMITGSGNEEVATTVLKAGADDYVVKRQGYVENLPGIIDYTIKNFHQKSQELKEIIEVLYIEHHSSDIDLTLRHMNQFAPYIRIDFVANAEEALEQIDMNEAGTCKYKVILLDYLLPGINALDFIKIIRQERKLDVPIIMVTGQGSEDVALQALKLGANDYMVKRENYLYRLPLAILNAYQHSELIKKQAALAESESKYRLLADNSGDVIFVLDKDLNYTYISPAIKTLRGFEPEEVIKQNISETLAPESFKKATKTLHEILAKNHDNSGLAPIQKIIELEMVCKDKTTVWTEVKASLITNDDNKMIGILGVSRDITARKLANDKLRKLSRAVDQSPSSVLITDLRGNIEYVNPKFSRVSGYSLEEVKGKNPRILKSGNTTQEEYKQLWDTVLSGGEWNGEFLNTKKNGSLFWESASISPIRNEEGEITHLLAVREDITEKKKEHEELIAAKEHALESEEKYKLLYENAGVGIGHYTPDGILISFNHVAAKFMDGNPEDFIGKSIFELSPKSEADLYFNRIQNAIIAAEPLVYEDLVQLPNDEKKWFLSAYTKIENSHNKIFGIQIVSQDISKLKTTEFELQKAKEKAEESDLLKSSFLANMSHEIRTPLNSIIGFSDLLNNPDFDEQQKSEFTKSIISNGDNLLLIINDIMDLSMIESGQLKVRKEPFSVNKLLIELEHEFITKASDKGIELRLEIPPGNNDVIIYNDLSRTRQIFINLIGNALKFTSKGFIEFGYSRKANFIEFYVIDSGIGVSFENYQAIFDRFRQVENARTRKFGGNGLGLAISKNLVELLGGRIWVESEVEKGSSFFFTLPFQSMLNEELTDPNLFLTKNDENKIKTMKILLAEDDDSSANLMSIITEKYAHKILNVKNGALAVETCRQNPDIDLILMDIQMPEMDGYEATRQIRQFNSDIVIIAQTAFALVGDKEKALEAGCTDYISKPIKKDKLFMLIEKYFP